MDQTTVPTSEQLAIAALNALADGLWVAAADGTLVLRNHAAMGLEQSTWHCVGSTRSPPEMLRDSGLAKAVHARGRWSAECDLIDANAGDRKILVEITPLLGSARESFGLVLRTRDVSDEHHREDVLQARNLELERAYAQLAQLQGQLLHAEKMASLGKLAAGVAHEINNPAAFVRSNLHTLQQYFRDLFRAVDAREGPPEREPLVVGVNEAGKQPTDLAFLREDTPALIAESQAGIDRICRIVSDLGEFAQAGRSHEDWRLADIHEGLRVTLKLAEAELHRDRIDVQMGIGQLPQIECLPAQLNQVFLDILVNAAQSIDGRGLIEIHTEAVDGQVCVSVIDDGCGIPAAVLPRVFDPFFTTRDIGATGLGLTVAYGIVQRHHGRIEVQSKSGQGTCVKVWLPIAQPFEEKGES